MNKKLLTISIVLISFIVSLRAQIIVQNLDYNPVIKQTQQVQMKSTVVTSVFRPPFPDETHYFFDDFYYYNKTVYPNSALWQDNYAFINSAYADSVISLGVATLDAADQNGNIWAIDDRPTPSDTLTSIAINISAATQNVYLSFFVQGGGKGDAPETGDSLVVEFFNKDSVKWKNVWSDTGYSSTQFKQVIIEVPADFRSDSFMFRFTNYTSLAEKVAPGKTESSLSNRDMWHIDYVQLRQVPDIDAMKLINDISFADVLDPTHKDYYSIPWEHIQYSNGGRSGTIRRLIRSYFAGKTTPVEINRYAISYNEYKGIHESIGEFIEELSSHDANNLREFLEPYNSQYVFEPGQKYGLYHRKSYLHIENEDQYVYNDTTVLVEKFLDYYAMDDGTAEFSFGFPGNGGTYMQFAQLYTFFGSRISDPDTLTAIDFYFSKTRNNAHADMEFTPVIWSYKKENENYYPDEIIYPSSKSHVDSFPRYRPDTNLGFNEFMRIELEDDLPVPDTVFVGFVQYGSDFLSLGYDISANNKAKMRFNAGNGWIIPQHSIPGGTVMIRPVFGHKVFTPVTETSETELLKIYPNPAKEYLILSNDQISGNLGNYSVQIIDVLGKIVYQDQVYDQQIDISELYNGLFVIRLIDQTNNKMYSQKFIKTD